MKGKDGNVPSRLLLFLGLTLLLGATELVVRFLPAAPHPGHDNLLGLTLLAFCALFFITEKLGLYVLNLRLYFLAMFTVLVKVFLEARAGTFSGESGLTILSSLLLLALLLALARYPIRMIKQDSAAGL